MLKENREYKEHLESIISEWKTVSNLNFPIFYRIDYDRHTLVLYSDRPGQLIGFKGETIEDLGSLLKSGSLGFNKIDVEEFKGGVVV